MMNEKNVLKIIDNLYIKINDRHWGFINDSSKIEFLNKEDVVYDDNYDKNQEQGR